MPKLRLTDLAISKLARPDKLRDYWDTALPGFGLRVSPKGSKTFILNHNNTRLKLGRYPHLKLADARAEAIRQKYQPTTASSISYEAARQYFFDRHLAHLKPTTAHEQRNLMRRFPFSKPLASITLDDINRILDAMPRGSARSCYNVFRTFLNWCIANNYLDRTPLKRSPYKVKPRDRLLTDAEIAEVWQVSLVNGTVGAISRCLILSGQRLNQFASFDRSWIKGDCLVFPGTVMKSNQEHTIPLTPLLRQHLPQLERPFNSYSTSMNRFRLALPQVEHFTPHDFRRYFSSTMARLRTPIDVTEALLNHIGGSRSQVQRIYDLYDRMEPMREALDRYERHLATLIRKP